MAWPVLRVKCLVAILRIGLGLVVRRLWSGRRECAATRVVWASRRREDNSLGWLMMGNLEAGETGRVGESWERRQMERERARCKDGRDG